jgi:hypothetical protein
MWLDRSSSEPIESGNAAAGRLHLPRNAGAEDLMFGRSNPRVARENRGLPRMEWRRIAAA